MNPVSADCIPLYVGILGHRDIADEDKPRLKKLIKQVLEEKKIQYPDTPIVVLTPLAEGADRLAAYSAMECGLSYIAILPMRLVEYKKDFKTQQSLQEFNDLLEKSEYWYELPLLNSKVQSLRSSKNRNDQYYNLGFHIARQSQMLIALWDGKINNKRGGTAHIVNLKFTGLPDIHPYFKHKLKNLQTGPVCHILTPRKGEIPPANAFSIKMIYGENQEQHEGSATDFQLLNNLDSFNRDIIRMRGILKDKSDLFPPKESNDDNSLGKTKKLHMIHPNYLIKDAQAKKFKSRRYITINALQNPYKHNFR